MKIPTVSALIFFLIIFQVKAQQNAADEIPTSKGLLRIQPIMHASMVLSWNGQTIYIDPTGSIELYKGIPAPDMILITDIHGDHMSFKTIEALNINNAILIAPQAVADQIPASLQEKLRVLMNEEESSELGMGIKAIAMYNLPEAADSRHIKGRGNGYVLTAGGKKIYISGDTEDIPEMRALKNIDVAFVCMNLPYTMDVNQASAGVLAFKPKIVYPYHHRGQDINEFKKLVNETDKDIDVRLRNWYP